MGLAKGERRQEVKKMNTGNGKEMADKDLEKKLLKVRMIRARKIGDVRWSRKGPATDEKEGRRERVNWNSGGQVRLSGFGQDHWEGEMGSWYQDQWWDSRTWRGKSKTKGFGRMEKRWRGSREKLQSDGGSTSKGEGGYSGSENEDPKRR